MTLFKPTVSIKAIYGLGVALISNLSDGDVGDDNFYDDELGGVT